MLKLTENMVEILVQAEKIGEEITINVKGGKAIVSSRDNNMAFLAKLEGVEEDPKVEEKYFFDKTSMLILKKCPGDIILEKKGDKIKLKSNSYKANLKEPKVKKTKNESFPKGKYHMGLSELNKVKKVLYAVSSDMNRPMITGVNFSIAEDEKLVIGSLDGYRIASNSMEIKKIKNMDTPPIGTEFTISKEILIKILSIVGDSAIISIDEAKKTVFFHKDNIIVAVDTLQGKFINYNDMFNQIKCDGSINVVREELIDAVNRCCIIKKDSTAVSLKQQNNELEISFGLNDKDVEVRETIPSDATKEIEISFNSQYLLEALNQIDAEDIEILVSDPSSGIKIIDGDNKALLLPVNKR
ncbi:DNA polymerase III subunit beta [Clostridium baratii]|uniref:DNA polymerase III subunit beta n=1 Tax=Clostridium baratii TaxID=1561 RepID=UPI0005F2D8BC|nr:DNA polymerase III subunit beta [Clostridium baratii]KJU70934.1 hypothetical protein UC77_12240 [Clostridium baratii]